MPVLYQIDKANGLIQTRCVGDVKLNEVIDHFWTLANDPNCPDHLDVLLDLREQTSLPESDQLREVTLAIRRIRPRVRFGACAIVASRDALYGMLRMFQVFTEELFDGAEVFRSIADAEKWLRTLRDRRGLHKKVKRGIRSHCPESGFLD